MLPRVNCEATRRAEDRACHSIVKVEVQFNVVVVDMWDKDLGNDIAQLLSDVLVVGCKYIGSMHWLLYASRFSDS